MPARHRFVVWERRKRKEEGEEKKNKAQRTPLGPPLRLNDSVRDAHEEKKKKKKEEEKRKREKKKVVGSVALRLLGVDHRRSQRPTFQKKKKREGRRKKGCHSFSMAFPGGVWVTSVLEYSSWRGRRKGKKKQKTKGEARGL